ncbi:MAG: alpha-L-fucosidase [Verrucomicrobiota bacterium]
MRSSDDLVKWTPPVTVIEAEGDEHLFNTAVCHDGHRFILLYETDDKQWTPFTFKYCESNDLVHWRRIPGAVYGREKYVGGPALYFEGGWFYTLYLQDLNGYSGGTWETRVTRSRDLLHWEDAPVERPFLAPDLSRVFTHQHRGLFADQQPSQPVQVREINASDAEICYWQGQTLVYFNGGDQQTCGDLQQAEFNGTPRELLERFYAEPTVPVPSPRQLAIQERQFGAFIHFGMATWYDGPARAVFPDSLRQPYAFNMDAWGLMVAQPPAATFNPTQLNPEQWVATAKAMGAKHAVLTAKHHNGFCLWPTRTTAYSVGRSPWRGGQGDVVREFVTAARQHGLGVGLYFSAGDVNAGCFSTPEPQGQRRLAGDLARYFPQAKAQLRELLTEYGPLDELWFDGALDPFGADVLQPDGTPVGSGYWDELVALVRQLQPAAVIMGGSQPDLRWPGNEEGLAPYPLACVVEPGKEKANWVPPGTVGWVVPEADVFTRPTWFWTPESDGALFGLDRLLDIYCRSIGHGANLLVNMTPDRRGLIPDAEVTRLTEFGAVLQHRFGNPLAETSSDGRWDEGMTLDLEFGRTATMRWVILEEDLRFGQRVRRYQLEARRNGVWSVVAEELTVGRLRITQLPASVEAEAVRLRVLDTVPLPKVGRMAAG